jgi:hypothetical protein
MRHVQTGCRNVRPGRVGGMIGSATRRKTVKYMLLIYMDPQAEEPPNRPDGAFEDWVKATEALQEDGVLLGGDGLQPVESATTVRNRSGERLLTDGPFAETKEHLLGYYLLDVPDIDAALRYAERLPMIGVGSVEVRATLESTAAA